MSNSRNTVYFENTGRIKESRAHREETRHGKQICQFQERTGAWWPWERKDKITPRKLIQGVTLFCVLVLKATVIFDIL